VVETSLETREGDQRVDVVTLWQAEVAEAEARASERARERAREASWQNGIRVRRGRERPRRGLIYAPG
jgi:hypothetical protein